VSRLPRLPARFAAWAVGAGLPAAFALPGDGLTGFSFARARARDALK
jgi:hypothetical protein